MPSYCNSQCQFYQETISSNQAEKFITNILSNNFKIEGLSKSYQFHYPVDNNINLQSISKINQTQNPTLVLIDFLNLYITPELDKKIIVQDDLIGLKIAVNHYLSIQDDLLSQIIFYSNNWRQLVNIGLSRISGYSNGYFWSKFPFTDNIEDWTTMQRRVIILTQVLYSYWDQYRVVEYCKSCSVNDNRDTYLIDRQERCSVCNSKVNRYHNPENRFVRYQYNDMFSNSNEIQVLDKEEYSVLSLLQWFHEKIRSSIKTSRKQNKR